MNHASCQCRTAFMTVCMALQRYVHYIHKRDAPAYVGWASSAQNQARCLCIVNSSSFAELALGDEAVKDIVQPDAPVF